MTQTYYTVQPDLEPIECTHWDAWDVDPRHTDVEQWEHIAWDIVHSWGKSLGIHFTFPECMFKTMHLYAFDVLLVQIMEHGYDVYNGIEFIEIYAPLE